ncbi:hypothetical protein ABIB06_001853 [Bradyrhizobium sp. LB8.2]|uniref:hypothetical protein n=1 Tax=Bradyrhizobium sp. LB8.2 TaxID=3156330 RepID=UPI00339152A1
MSEPVPTKPKATPTESDLSQVMAHGPALSQAFGPRLGALVLMFGLAKTRYGSFGIATIITAVGGIVYNFLK